MMPGNPVPRRLLTVTLMLLAACTERGSDTKPPAHGSPAAAGSDAAEFEARDLARLTEWRLDSTPLTIGAATGEPAYLLNRAGMPWRLKSGQIVVPNNQAEIRWFDSSGRYIRTVGRKGQGPGEFGQLWNVFPGPGDTLLATDAAQNRASIIDSAGRFVRTVEIPDASYPVGLNWLAEGTAVYYRTLRTAPAPGEPDTAVLLDSVVLLRASLADGRRDTLARLKGYWHFAPIPRSYQSLEFAGEPLLATGPGTIVAAHGDDFVISWFDTSGRLRRAARGNVRRQRVPERMIEAYREEVTKARRVIAEGGGVPPSGPIRHAEYVPAITRLAVDRAGRTWVRRWAETGAPSAEWIVFDTTGVPIARARLPVTFLFADAGDDYILGRHTDEDGVQSIRKYRLMR